ncbi:hypothetical protein C8Q80DRAFT_1345360 [Daedaleopsis nitida]|nr:hypothetical protein C8Q80DRAFT_1345360 [Daedaleopsis nitida]
MHRQIRVNPDMHINDHASALNFAVLDTRHTEVFLLVYPPRRNDATRHDLHWSLAWQFDDRRWTYVHLSVQDGRSVDNGRGRSADTAPTQQYCPSCGAQTQHAPAHGEGPRPLSLGRMSVRMRNRVEEIARGVPVCAPGGLWTCQHWILGVLRRMADDGIISQRVLEDTVGSAYNAHFKIEELPDFNW